MTFNANECFIYITLPGQTEFVTAGRLSIVKNRQGIAVGRFVYGASYLARPDAVPFDPVELKLTNTVYETVKLNGMFSALRDSGPDYWGRCLIERYLGQTQLNEIDYLLYSPDDRAGALGFGLNQTPPTPKHQFNQTLELAKLQKIADAVVSGQTNFSINKKETQIVDIMLAGTSMGGARPKAVVEDEKGLWLAKFNRADDKWNYARVEHAMLLLAKACGIRAAESKLVAVGKRDVLLVKRFDREKCGSHYRRARMISALTLLQAEDSYYRSKEKWSYILLAESLRQIGARPKKDALELFRRLCFNALISNTDDHPRNHAFISFEKDWYLSPAYDLMPMPLISLEQRDLAMACGNQGRVASKENILSQCGKFLIEPEYASLIIDDMTKQIHKDWRKTMRAAGVSEKDCELLKMAFAYPGFEMKKRCH